MFHKENILDILVQKGVFITPEVFDDVVKVAESNGRSIEEIILEKKIINAEDLTQIKSEIYNLPYIDLRKKEIDSQILNKISKNISENYQVVCFDRDKDVIKIGIVDPDNFKAIEAVDYLAKGQGLRVEYYFISRESFLSASKQYVSLTQELTSALETKMSESDVVNIKDEEKVELSDITKNAPVIRIVSVIIRHAVEGNASDIHIEPIQKEVRIRYRVDGILHTSLVLPRSIHEAIVSRIKVMASLKLDETRIPQDGHIRLMVNEKEFDFRVSILPLIDTEKVVMRVFDMARNAPTFEELGYEGEQYDLVKKSTEKTDGLIVVTGPTGSGKSTTLFSILNIINKEDVNISTLEDPVEYQIKGINQSQVKPEIGYTFAAGLRSFLRQDPDVIMVGEIRDQETCELAIHAAMTGHLVFSTVHTLDAIGTIDRLLDIGAESFLLGATLKMVIAQRLVRRICQNCKEEVTLSENYLTEVKKELAEIGPEYLSEVISGFKEGDIKFFKGKGCSHCGNTGYSGRIAISEVLFLNKEIKDLVISGVEKLSIKTIRKYQKFITIKQDGVIKILKGMTTIDEVLRVMRD